MIEWLGITVLSDNQAAEFAGRARLGEWQ